MKKIVGFVLAFGVVALAFGYASGVFDVKAEVKVNENVKDTMTESSYRALEEAQEGTHKVFETMKEYLEKDNDSR